MAASIVHRVFLAACLAGAMAGILLTALQQLAVSPMILAAETYEHAGHDAGPGGQTPEEAGVWVPAEGIERTAYTALANVLTAVGFGLLLTACYALREEIDWQRGLLWGLGGFAVFSLAPALGMAPVLPGAATAAVEARQAWWLLCVLCTACGLTLMVFGRHIAVRAFAFFILLVPQMLGAPQPETHGALAPEALARAFVSASLLTNAVFWVVLGVLTGWFFERFCPRSAEGDVRAEECPG
jgi:cobalt transporter subunit CbtA